MIITINGSDRSVYPNLIDQMHKIRKETFFDRLKWDVEVRGNWEIDDFDFCDPLYVLSLDENENVRGSLRLLPTTGPNMLRDVFNCLLPQNNVVESPTIWESSRFCVSLRDPCGKRSLSSLNLVTAELIAGMGEIGVLAGLTNIVTVYDHFLRRIIARAGCNETLVGGPMDIGGVKTYAGMFKIDPDELTEFKKDWDIKGNLLEPRRPHESTAAA